MPKIVMDDGFVIGWGPYTKKELDEMWAKGINSAPVSSPSLSLSTKEMRSKKAPNRSPVSSPALSSSKEFLRPEERADPRWEGDTGLAGLLESD